MPVGIPERIGRYRIVEVLGKGAMGTVYRGRDEGLDRDVAVKVMSVDAADDDARARFLREGKAAARFQHPNIVTIYELGEHESQLFMALELLEGMDLQRAIEAGMRPDPKATLPVVLHLLAGLGHAHEHGIVHRDVKPSNLFLPRARPAKIMDFGVARLVGTHTSTGLVIGTPNYMSPEQVRAGDLDGRSDLFSAGLILYELVTGEKAYRADSIVALLFKIAHEEPDFDLIPKGAAWERLRGVLRRSLSKDKDARYPDAHSMAADLEQALRDLGGVFDRGAGADQALLGGMTPRPMPAPTFVAPATRAPAATASAVATPPPAGPIRDVVLPAPPVPPAAGTDASKRTWLVGGGLAGVAVVLLGIAAVVALRRPESPAPVQKAAVPPTPSSSPSASAAPSTAPSRAPSMSPSVAPSVRPSAPVASPTTAIAIPSPEATPPPPGGGTTEARLRRANDAMEKGRYAQALAEARAVLEKDPGNAEAKDLASDAEASLVIEDAVKKARAALKTGDKDAALREVKKGLAVNASEGRLLALFREATQ
jgi:serine/threonine-protein kinase